MADSEHSSSDDNDLDSTVYLTEEESSDGLKLEFAEDEEILIIGIYILIGERWSLIAGRTPGRTTEEIEKYWNSRYSTSE